MKLNLIVILSAVLQSTIAASLYHRKYLDTTNLKEALTCHNTEFGREYIADDQGYVCYRKNLNYETGCCIDGVHYQCASCDKDDRCCTIYEHCVSCCLGPENGAEHKYHEKVNSPKYKDDGFWDNVFEYCKAKCRTHGRSTIHENAFISQKHYCFSDSGIPNVQEPMLPELPNYINVELSKEGKDCHETCDAVGMQCSNDHFVSLNSCNVMRRYFGCEADCSVKDDAREGGPFYIVESAPNAEHPAACVIWRAEDGVQTKKLLGGNLDLCQWRKDHVIRLCPCMA